MTKKALFLCSILFIMYSCTASKESTSTDKKEKIEAPVKPATMDRDTKGNYLK